ncbi:MAG: polysaccharide deacetylase, partial [Desulfovibrio sp.]
PSCYKETTEQFIFRVEQELRQSREALEALSGGPITALAWPWGAYCRAGQRAAQAAGFELLFTTKRGAVRKGSNPLAISRLEVRPHKGLSWFSNRMTIYSQSQFASLYSRIRL